MREVDFFQTLLRNVREEGGNMFVSLPSKVTYPAWECELLESKHYPDRCIVRFYLKGYFNDLNTDAQIKEVQKIKKLLEQPLPELRGISSHSSRILNEKWLPREKGNLKVFQSEWEFLFRA